MTKPNTDKGKSKSKSLKQSSTPSPRRSIRLAADDLQSNQPQTKLQEAEQTQVDDGAPLSSLRKPKRVLGPKSRNQHGRKSDLKREDNNYALYNKELQEVKETIEELKKEVDELRCEVQELLESIEECVNARVEAMVEERLRAFFEFIQNLNQDSPSPSDGNSSSTSFSGSGSDSDESDSMF